MNTNAATCLISPSSTPSIHCSRIRDTIRGMLKIFALTISTVVVIVLAVSAQTPSAPAGDPPTLRYTLTEWPTPPTGAAGVPSPWNFIQVASVAVTPRGTILIFHRGAHPIMEFESGGKFVRSWGDGMFSEGKVAAIPEKFWTADKSHYSAVYGPAGCTSCGAHSVRLDGDRNIWVVDAPGHIVVKLNRDGKELMHLGAKGVSGSDAGHFNLP